MADNASTTGEIPVTKISKGGSNSVTLSIVAGTVAIILSIIVGSTFLTIAGLEPPKYFEVTVTASLGLLAGILAGGASRRAGND